MTIRRLVLVVAALALSLTGITDAPAAESVCARFGAGTVGGQVKNPRLTEISGLVASRVHPGVFWTHNDSGGNPEVFALTLTGADLGAYTLTGAGAVDWEDIAIGPKRGAPGSFLYVGDIGNNGALAPVVMGDPRTRVTIYRVPEPAAAPAAPGALLGGVEKFDLVYPGTPVDAEAMFVDPISGDLVIISKSPIGLSQILIAPAASMVDGAQVALVDAGTILIAPVINPSSTFPGTFVTGADISADGALILVRTYQAVLAFVRSPGQSVASALKAGSCDAPQTSETQGEAIALAADGSRYATISEGGAQPVHVFAVTAAAAPTTMGPTTAPAVRGELLPRSGRTDEAVLAFAAAAVIAVVLVRRTRIGRDGEI